MADNNPFRAEIERRAALELARSNSVMASRARSGGPIADFVVGFGNEFARLLPGVDPPGLRPPDTLAASAGDFAPETLASFALPARGLLGVAAQGALGGGAQLLRNPDDPLGAGFAAGLSGAGTLVGDIGGRTITGTAARVINRIRGSAQLLRTKSQTLRTLSETLGGSGGFNQQQQRVVNRAWTEALGEGGDIVSPRVRQRAAERIGNEMDAALPTSTVDVAAPAVTLNNVPGSVFPGKTRVLQNLAKAIDDPKAYQSVTRELRDTIRKMRRSPELSAWADEVSRGLDELGEAGTKAGAANTRVVREQYKNLMLLESIPTVRRTGNVPPISAEGRIQSQFGKSTTRNAGQGTLPETERAIGTTQEAAAELSGRFRSSGTAERGAQAEAAQDVVGVLTGQTSPSRLLRTLGTLAFIGPVAGAAATGRNVPGTGQLGAFGARQLNSLLDRDDEQ